MASAGLPTSQEFLEMLGATPDEKHPEQLLLERVVYKDFDAGTKHLLGFELRGANGRVREARRLDAGMTPLELAESLEYLAAWLRSRDRDSRDANSVPLVPQ